MAFAKEESSSDWEIHKLDDCARDRTVFGFAIVSELTQWSTAFCLQSVRMLTFYLKDASALQVSIDQQFE